MKEPMQDIWKGAPDGATHYSEDNQLFYKKKDGALYFWRINLPHWWVRSDYEPDEHHLLKLIERPSQSWHERGELPPVGENCRYLLPNDQAFQSGVIAAHVCGKTAIIDFGDSWAASEDPKRFFPELSDREKAIDFLCDFLIRHGGKPIEKATALYDAGYRKVE